MEEIENATAYYSADPRPTKGYKHKVYKADAVRNPLNHAFGHKCAYCESSYGETQPVDIEHYRPKAEVLTPAGAPLKPGYFWLAATWTNLLPSCIDCNRVRKHTGRDGREHTLGKGNQFPLVDEAARALTPGAAVDDEGPLLLHPYDDDPERHLEFQLDGTVRPSEDRTQADREDPKGRATIDVVALNRPLLVHARRKHAKRVEIQLARVADAEANIRMHPSHQALLPQLRREIEQLRELTAPDSPYLGLASQMIAARPVGTTAPGA